LNAFTGKLEVGWGFEMTENIEKPKFWGKINPLWVIVFLLLVLVWQNRWKLVVSDSDWVAYKLDTFTGNVYWQARGSAWMKIKG